MATRKAATTPGSQSEAPLATSTTVSTTASATASVKSISHRAKRKNIPPAGLEAQGRVEEAPKVRFEYNPHLPPVLRFADDPAAADRLPQLLATARERALSADEAAVLAEALRRHEPWLEWAGKRERPWFEVDPPALHIHERVSTQAMLRVLAREPEMVKAYRDTWTLGIHSYLAYLRDRLMMARELLAESGSVFVQISDENLHRVRCVMDDVLGAENFVSVISFKTTTTGSGDLLATVNDFLVWYAKDKQRIKLNPVYLPKDDEPDNIYKYLEFASGHELTLGASHAESRSAMLDESRLFSMDNITSSRPAGDGDLKSYEFQGVQYPVTKGTFKSDGPGLKRLERANRLGVTGSTLRYKRMFLDFAVTPVANMWTDTSTGSFTESKVYVVQTATKVVDRCLLMTTDPGDLVLDPTCGSGTTAFVAEKWGRRWIAVDSSRVALALAKHRLMTASFDHFKLRPLSPEDLERNPRGSWLRNGGPEPKTFDCKTVPHITLKSIARNTSLDPIFAKHEPVLAEKLAALNQALAKATPELKGRLADKLTRKHRENGTSAVNEADIRRWLLPGTHPAHLREAKAAKPLKALTAKQVQAYRAAIPTGDWQAWQAPFDTDADWPKALADALTAYRAAWRAKMDEVNSCIAANAEVEELVDQPLPAPGVVRVAGPFTMEGVIAHEQGPDDDSPIGGAPDELEAFDGAAMAAGALGVVNAEAHLDKIMRLLKASGVDFVGNVNKRFARLEPIASSALLHAEGAWTDDGERRVAVSVGPEVGNVSAYQVEDAVRSANRMGYDEVVLAGFGFDAAAQAAIDESGHPKLRLHMALIRPDVAMGDLLKTQPGSQLFMVFSAPRVKPAQRLSDGQFTVEVEGMDVYDPVSNALFPTSRDRIADWFVDTDYDGRTFCICQAFFPDRKKWDKLARALGDKGVVDEGRFDALSGFECLPFTRPTHLPARAPWRVAVKVIDPRGNEGLRVLTMPERLEAREP